MPSFDLRKLQRFINHLLSLLRSLWRCLRCWWTRTSQTPIILDNGRRVFKGRKIADGGFSLVFEAYDANSSGLNTLYALKIVHGDNETLLNCRKEAKVHLSVSNPNVLSLLGTQFTSNQALFLFPYYPGSLRSEVHRRVDQAAVTLRNSSSSIRPSSFSLNFPSAPWTEIELLIIFQGILTGVQAMHQAGFSHRDIKLDNILLSSSSSSSLSSAEASLSSWSLPRPILMDLGSAGPTREDMDTRKHIIQAVESASMYTTMSYRPPELFEGGTRVGDWVDYTRVDVWGLACTLFAMSYGQGASPTECEFLVKSSWNTTAANATALSTSGLAVKRVDCSYLKVLAGLPSNPPPWYSSILWDLLVGMMEADPKRRLSMSDVMERVHSQIQQLDGGGDVAGKQFVDNQHPTASRPSRFDNHQDIELLSDRFV